MVEYTPMQAWRMADRILAPIMKQQCDAADRDSAFDAGEFSGSWHSRQMYDEQERVFELVANRTGIPLPLIHKAGCQAFDKACESAYEKGFPIIF